MRTRVLAAALMTGLLAACGGQAAPGPPAENPPPSTAQPRPSETDDGSVDLPGSPTIEEIRQRGVLMVGLRADDPRFATREGAGEYGGFDVEIANIVAEGLGMTPAQVSFRWLPPSLVVNAVASANVDIQIGGLAPNAPGTSTVGPYAVTGDVRHFIGIQPGDDAMRAQLQRVLDAAVADGRWQRAYDATLGATGVPATPR